MCKFITNKLRIKIMQDRGSLCCIHYFPSFLDEHYWALIFKNVVKQKDSESWYLTECVVSLTSKYYKVYVHIPTVHFVLKIINYYVS